MAARIWFAGALLVALGLAARFVGWDPLLSIPAMIMEAVRSEPETYGVIALGVLLMVAARVLGRRGP